MRVEDVKFNFAMARVAIIDPSRFAYFMMRGVLSGFGFRDITGFESAQAAVARLVMAPADLVLCDPFPEVEATFALLRKLREPRFGETALAPILIVTGGVGIDIVQGAKACQADFVIAKPYSANILLERIIWAANKLSRQDSMARPFVEMSSNNDADVVELW